MKYSQKLKEVIKIREIRQEDLARELGVTFASLNRWVNEVTHPRVTNQIKIDVIYNQIFGNFDVEESYLVKIKKEIIAECKVIKIDTLFKRDYFIKNLIIRMTYSSNKLEGSTMTESEVNDVLYENATFNNRSMLEHLEAKNHESALLYVLDNYKKEISSDYILKLSGILMNGIKSDAGNYRNHNVRIAGSYVPTVNHMSISKRINEFVVFCKAKHKDKIFFISKMHADFESIHPFSDGNGRIGRLLMIHFALKYDLLPTIIAPEKRKQYLSSLQKAQLDNDYAMLQVVVIESTKESFKLI